MNHRFQTEAVRLGGKRGTRHWKLGESTRILQTGLLGAREAPTQTGVKETQRGGRERCRDRGGPEQGVERPAGRQGAQAWRGREGGLTCVPAWPAWATAVPGRGQALAAPDVRRLRRSACSSMPPHPQPPRAAPQGLGTEEWQRWAAHSAQRTATGLGKDGALGGSGVQAPRLPPQTWGSRPHTSPLRPWGPGPTPLPLRPGVQAPHLLPQTRESRPQPLWAQTFAPPPPTSGGPAAECASCSD